MRPSYRWMVAIGAALAAVSAVAGCAAPAGDDTVVVVDGDPELVPAPDWDEYLQAARAAGGDSGYYIVEGDLVFHNQEALRAHYDELRESADKLATIRQLSTGFEPIYRGTAPLRIRYCVSDNFNANKNNVVAAVASATRSWQNVANVRFVYDPSQDASCNKDNANVEFAVLRFPGFSLILGCGANKMVWPELASSCLGPGTLGLVPQAGIESQPPPNENLTLAGAIRHELGHILGFRHEHPWAPGQGGCAEEPPDVPLADLGGRRLTPYDQFSVMHYARCGGISGADMQISRDDGIGSRRVYGMPASWYVASLGVSAWF